MKAFRKLFGILTPEEKYDKVRTQYWETKHDISRLRTALEEAENRLDIFRAELANKAIESCLKGKEEL